MDDQLRQLSAMRDAILAEVSRVIVGQTDALDALLVAFLRRATCCSRAFRAPPRP